MGGEMPIDDQRRSRIKKGMFLTSSPVPPGYVAKRKPLPADLEQFEGAAAAADDMAAIDRRHASAISELARRLQAVRDELASYQKARGKK
jgi:hypothetical protein